MEQRFLGRYECIRRIARGGMAELYLARFKAAGGAQKLVAIKRVLPHFADDPEFVRMFRNETRIAATLDHPNIAQVLDFSEDGEERFIVMEYVHGVTLREILRRGAAGGGVPLPCVLTIIAGIAQGLHYAHEARGPDGRALELVHRDLSPTNVLVTYDGAVKIVDFGIAKATTHTRATRTGTLKGKPSYMSPEQCRIAPVDRRSDVFALGILLYEASTLRRLFAGPNDYAIMNLVADCDFAAPSEIIEDYPPELERIVLRALRADPAERYETARALHEDLEDFAANHGLSISALTLADHLERDFEREEYPAVDWTVPALPMTREPPAVAPIGPARRLRRVAQTAVLGIAVGATGYVLGGRARSDPEPNVVAEPSASGVSEKSPEVQAGPIPVAAPTHEPPVAPLEDQPGQAVADQEPAADGDASPPTAAAEALPQPSPPPPKRKRPKRRKKPKAEPLRGSSSLLPPSGRVDR